MPEPLVSVLIVGRNVGPWVRETVESALGQTWARREIIAVNDGSTDDTAAILDSYGSRIRVLHRAADGLAAGRNAGLAVASGDYVALLDADDLWLPEKLEVQVAVARRHPESGLVACDGVEFGPIVPLRQQLLSTALRRLVAEAPDGEVTGRFHELFIAAAPFACPALTLIPRPVMTRLGGFEDIMSQDYEYYLRIAREYPVTVHRQSLVRWRYRPGGLSGPQQRRAVEWSLGDQPVFRVHSRRCDARERALILARRRELARQTAGRALALADAGDREYAVRALRRLVREGPWPPVAVPYLVAVVAPKAVRRLLARWSGRRSDG